MDIMSTQSRSDGRVRALEKNDLDMGGVGPIARCRQSSVHRAAAGVWMILPPVAGARHLNHGHRGTRSVSTRLELGLRRLARSARIGYSRICEDIQKNESMKDQSWRVA
jgi:hypothetical protein